MHLQTDDMEAERSAEKICEYEIPACVSEVEGTTKIK